jgi:hypothetical protein
MCKHVNTTKMAEIQYDANSSRLPGQCKKYRISTTVFFLNVNPRSVSAVDTYQRFVGIIFSHLQGKIESVFWLYSLQGIRIGVS